jgi:hypothetical protein
MEVIGQINRLAVLLEEIPSALHSIGGLVVPRGGLNPSKKGKMSFLRRK